MTRVNRKLFLIAPGVTFQFPTPLWQRRATLGSEREKKTEKAVIESQTHSNWHYRRAQNFFVVVISYANSHLDVNTRAVECRVL